LERGLLTGKIKPGYQFASGDHRKDVSFFKDENIKRTDDFLSMIRPIAAERQIKLSQLVILWTLQQPGITIALVGARNSEQAIENARALDIELTEDELAIISGYLNQLELVS
jgi:aryl-alcohol dehydrogenase-like predicted oxidoreductase